MKFSRFHAVDSGGTTIRQVLFDERDDGRLEQLGDPVITACKSVTGLEDAILEFVGDTHIDGAGIAAAGPVEDGVCRFTNLPWLVDGKAVATSLRLRTGSSFEPNVTVINDLESCMHGINLLPPECFFVLHPGREGAHGNRAVISAGTGLGEAGECFDKLTGTRHPYATEGGHCLFAPSSARQDVAMLQHFHDLGLEPTWEDLLSGNGLARLYDFVFAHSWLPIVGAPDLRQCGEDKPATISRLALAGEDPKCEQALNLFVHLYGTEARNLALKTGAKGGLFVAGDIAIKNLARFKVDSTFVNSFLQHKVPNMRDLLAGIPVKVVLVNANLLGAASVAQKVFNCGR